jgi:hypothetical protein
MIMPKELGAKVPIRAAALRPRHSPTGNRITGKLLAAEHSSGAQVPFRDS